MSELEVGDKVTVVLQEDDAWLDDLGHTYTGIVDEVNENGTVWIGEKYFIQVRGTTKLNNVTKVKES